jgi:hypothetical protein
LYYYNARYYDPHVGRFIQPDTLVPDPLNPQAWNRFSYCYNNPTSYVDPSGHIPFWDVLDVASFAWSSYELYRDPSWANLGWWALDAISLLPLIPSIGLLRHGDEAVDLLRAAGRMEDVGDARRIIVELGSGDFTNLPRIVADNPGARVIGIEHPEMRGIIELAQQHPGVMSEWDEIARGYEAALGAGAEIRFLDYTTDLPASFADEVISIAPNPVGGVLGTATPRQTAEALAHIVKPGGHIYAASDSATAALIVSQRLGEVYGTTVSFQTIARARVPYVSRFLDLNMRGVSHVLDFWVP